MVKFVWSALFLGFIVVGSTGCGGGSDSSALENADQAAIDEYQRIEAEEQARLANEMKSSK
tara:strand:- start:1295 stop:1477 length:183 start_codon:yes stop_codon:yes gene_type:complete